MKEDSMKKDLNVKKDVNANIVNEKEDEKDYSGEDYSDFDYDNENLNKLSTVELKKHKKLMEKKFKKNAILPESDNFVYNVEKEFDCQDYDNEWDDEI